MADFPALEPNTRSYDLGDVPSTFEASLGGSTVRFLHADAAVGFKLTLGFLDLSDDAMASIRSHYATQMSTFLGFALSSVTTTPGSIVTSFMPATATWRYATVPEETQKSGGLYDVTVSLIAAF